MAVICSFILCYFIIWHLVNASMFSCCKRTLDEKKLAREEAKNAERSAMQSFHNKNEMVDVYTEVI